MFWFGHYSMVVTPWFSVDRRHPALSAAVVSIECIARKKTSSGSFATASRGFAWSGCEYRSLNFAHSCSPRTHGKESHALHASYLLFWRAGCGMLVFILGHAFVIFSEFFFQLVPSPSDGDTEYSRIRHTMPL